jgi:hypothetical protein
MLFPGPLRLAPLAGLLAPVACRSGKAAEATHRLAEVRGPAHRTPSRDAA